MPKGGGYARAVDAIILRCIWNDALSSVLCAPLVVQREEVLSMSTLEPAADVHCTSSTHPSEYYTAPQAVGGAVVGVSRLET